MNEYQPNKFERLAARCAAGLDKHDHPPVVVRPGDAAPALTGERWYYETRGGTRIDHPHAYSQVGWSSMVYRPSTRRVEVGADWLRARTHSVTITDFEMGVAA
jgi:hypothetical protein